MANDAQMPDVRLWDYYPIEMPLTADGKGPATVGVDAARIAYEVWDHDLSSHATYDNLPDAINEAMRLNAALPSDPAADLCASGQQVRADRHQIAREIWDAMTWAAYQGAPDGALPKYMEWGNSFGECEARRTADRILAALTPAPQPEGFSINPEYQAIFDEAKARAPQAAGEAVPVDLSHGWLIHKAGRGWYRPNAKGYTGCIAEAGRYSHEDALAYSHPNGWDGPRDNITIKHESEVAHPPQPSETVAEAAQVLLSNTAAIRTLVDFQLRHSASASDRARSMRHVQMVAALRALKGLDK